jgi:hypothetical protein
VMAYVTEIRLGYAQALSSNLIGIHLIISVNVIGQNMNNLYEIRLYKNLALVLLRNKAWHKYDYINVNTVAAD